MKLYTRTGDGGESSLLSGGRVAKDDPRLEAYGTVDELSSWLGLLRSEPLPAGVGERLAAVQETLFAVGAALADAEGRHAADRAPWPTADLERWIDELEEELEPLAAFILPGGARAATTAHLARSVCRRAERRVCALGGGDPVAAGTVPYLNRLSDLLFALARLLNARLGVPERRWRQGA